MHAAKCGVQQPIWRQQFVTASVCLQKGLSLHYAFCRGEPLLPLFSRASSKLAAGISRDKLVVRFG